MPKQKETLDLETYPIAAGTRKTYGWQLDKMDRWLKDRPMNDETLSGYVVHLFDEGKSPSYATVALAAARWRCLSEDKPDPRGNLCQRAIASFRRKGKGRGRGQVDGVQWPQVDAVVSLALKDKDLYGLRDAAIIATGSDAALRISEITAIEVDHVDFEEASLYIPESKTDQEGDGAFEHLGDKTLDYIRAWMDKGKVSDGPMFRPIHRDHHYGMKRKMTTYTVREVIQSRCKAAGLTGRISGHSLRVGTTESMAIGGASDADMQRVGRWKSPLMPARYSRKIRSQQNAVARLRYGK